MTTSKAGRSSFASATVIGYVAVLICSCSHPAVYTDTITVPKRVASQPTATETFNLRSECAKLGQKIMEGNTIGSALTQDVVTHYDPPTNRCYAELDVNTADLSKFTDDYSRYVYDAQTGELLASVGNDHGKKTAYVKDGGGLKVTGWDQAIIQIESLMADDRKQ
jgi:hypothetical protein